MTSPLETKARALADRAWRLALDLQFTANEEAEKRGQVTANWREDTAERLLAFASEVEREALERAAKVECLFCRGGRPVKRSKKGNYYHEAAPGWKGDYRDGSHDCHATNIRSLSEPPAEEPKP